MAERLMPGTGEIRVKDGINVETIVYRHGCTRETKGGTLRIA